jgi:SpoVK/Ycf46/Vps4 family AAA+-type ATPase
MPTGQEDPTFEIESFVQQLATTASPFELVVSDSTRQQLEEISARARHKGEGALSFPGSSQSASRNVSALFAGPSGTGKTLAAQVLATQLRLDLWRVNLGAVTSKFLGDTAKQLNQIFEAAEDDNSILLFDEADALFGRRSGPNDAHDRYANIDIAYLLQRLEGHPGLVILTSNMRNNLDPAFTRRMHAVVDFARPDLALREVIWKRVFPRKAALATDVDFARLAKLPLSGGEIRSIAQRALLGAEAQATPITMPAILQSTREELHKLGRSDEVVSV